jgi:hypothetical protein
MKAMEAVRTGLKLMEPGVRLVKRHERGLCTIGIIAGVIATTINALKDGPKLEKVLEEIKDDPEMSNVDKLKKVGGATKNTLISAGATIGFAGVAHHTATRYIGDAMDTAQVATLALQQHQQATKEVVGPEKAKEIEKKAEEKSYQHFVSCDGRAHMTGYGTELFQLGWTNQWFYSRLNTIEKQLNELKSEGNEYISVNRLERKLGIPESDGGANMFFWVGHNDLELVTSEYRDPDSNERYTVLKFWDDPISAFEIENRTGQRQLE